MKKQTQKPAENERPAAEQALQPAPKKYNDENLTIQIPLTEYRDLLVVATRQEYEIRELQFMIQRLQTAAADAGKRKRETELALEALQGRYTAVEKWLKTNSYHRDCFLQWRNDRAKAEAEEKGAPPQFSDDAGNK